MNLAYEIVGQKSLKFLGQASRLDNHGKADVSVSSLKAEHGRIPSSRGLIKNNLLYSKFVDLNVNAT
jgi:hypothetical protein